MDDPKRFTPPVVAVLSGGNIDPLLLMRVIRHGMASAGRYLSLRVRIPDTPGGLATLLARLAEVDANLIEVAHERISPTLSLDEVEVLLQLETRGDEHRRRVLTCLRSFGYTYLLN
jgi:threonine dehydratase